MDLGGAAGRRWAALRKVPRRWAAVTVTGVLAAGASLVWAVGDAPSPVRAEQHRIEVVDGPAGDRRITLDATFFPPAGRADAPAVLLAHGFGGSKASVRAEAEDLARAGYAVLTWSARGFGDSGGQITLNSPDHEVKDARQLIDWLARRPEVRKDRPGDPRVGMAGESYGGAIALLTAAHDPRVDTIVPRLTWHDLADALFPDADGDGPHEGVFKKLWAGVFFTSGAGSGRPPTACGRFRPELCAMYQQVAETGRATPEAVRTLRRSSPAAHADRIRVPTLLVQGQSDSLFPLDHADANAHAIARNGAHLPGAGRGRPGHPAHRRGADRHQPRRRKPGRRLGPARAGRAGRAGRGRAAGRPARPVGGFRVRAAGGAAAPDRGAVRADPGVRRRRGRAVRQAAGRRAGRPGGPGPAAGRPAARGRRR